MSAITARPARTPRLIADLIMLERLDRELGRMVILPPDQMRRALTIVVDNSEGGRIGLNAPLVDRRNLAALHAARRAPVVRKYSAAIQGALDGAKAQVLKKLRAGYEPSEVGRNGRIAPIQNARGSGAAAEFLFDPDQFGDDFMARIHGVTEDALTEAGQQLYDELPEPPDDPFTMPAPRLREYLHDREEKLSNFPDEVRGTIGDALDAGYDAGESLAELTKRVEGAFDGIAKGRAKVVAKTETHSAFGAARHTAMQQQGVEKEQWLVSMSPLIKKHRALHLEIDGQVADIDKPFQYPDGQGDYLQYPGDPKGAAEDVINCGCTSIPHFDDLIANIWDPAKHPRDAHGKFAASTDPMQLGSRFEKRRKKIEDLMDKAGIGDGKTSAATASANLRAALKVKNPIKASTLVTVTGATANEEALIMREAQQVLDMVPQGVAKKLGKLGPLTVRVIDDPHDTRPAWYDPAWGGANGSIVFNRAQNSVNRKNVWHEMGHFLHDQGPDSYKAAVKLHFQRRTAGEAMQTHPTLGHDFLRDKLSDDYEGRVYRQEAADPGGLEIPSVRLEHLSFGNMGVSSMPSNSNAKAYRETSTVALSIFLHGRKL